MLGDIEACLVLVHFVTLQHFTGEIFGIPENVPRFLKNVFHIPDERQLGLASLCL